MSKVKTFKTIFQYKKLEKETLKEITMLINTFHGKQDHSFTKIYKSINLITE